MAELTAVTPAPKRHATAIDPGKSFQLCRRRNLIERFRRAQVPAMQTSENFEEKMKKGKGRRRWRRGSGDVIKRCALCLYVNRLQPCPRPPVPLYVCYDSSKEFKGITNLPSTVTTANPLLATHSSNDNRNDLVTRMLPGPPYTFGEVKCGRVTCDV